MIRKTPVTTTIPKTIPEIHNPTAVGFTVSDSIMLTWNRYTGSFAISLVSTDPDSGTLKWGTPTTCVDSASDLQDARKVAREYRDRWDESMKEVTQ